MTATTFYPVAGCAGIALSEAGDYDKRWFVVDEAARWLSPDVCPALGQVTTEMRMGYLVLRAPGMLRMDIPLEVIEDDDSVWRQVSVGTQNVDVVDEGEVAAVWFGHVVGSPCRLVKLRPEATPVQWPV